MSDRRAMKSPGEICPYLGTANDPAVRYLGTSPLHRCHSDSRPRQIGTGHQDGYCLSEAHRNCLRWYSDEDETLEPEGVDFPSGWDGRSLWDTTSGFIRYLGSGLLGLAWLALTLTAIVLLTPLLTAASQGNRPGTLPVRDLPAASGRPAVEAPQRQEAVAAPVLRPTAAPADGEGVNQSVPLPRPAPAPTPRPDPTRIPAAAPAVAAGANKAYVVQQKDTLWSLARANSVSVDDIMKANGITNRDHIKAGQTLIIPPSKDPR